MTDTQMSDLLLWLQRKLELETPDKTALSDRLYEAEWELRAYLGYLDTELPEAFYTKLVELAALYYQRDGADTANGGLKSASYSEGDVSQSESYLTAEDWQARASALLASLARYRRVRC